MIFGKRLIRKRIKQESAKRVETRDAILWEIIPSQKICRVKIQGSDTLLQARYPENTHQTPEWMKVGSAVRVQHVGGNRNSVEVVGPGLIVPTAVPGGSAEPTLATGENTILSGCQIYALSDMNVRITTGTYRINDVVYTLEGDWVMSADDPLVMSADNPLIMGVDCGIFPVSAASATLSRMDAFFVGIDGVIDYAVGTPSATNPQIPTTPATHVLIGWIMVPPGTTEITQSLIGYPFVEPVVSQMSAVAALEQLTWTDASTTITVTVKDQYGNGITGTNWRILASIISGTGTIEPSKLTGTSSSTATFTYGRSAGYSTDPEVVEDCPVLLEFSLSQNIGITMLTALVLEDETGGLIFG